MVFTFAGTIANWIDDDWQMIERMVNFYHIQDKDHEGEWAAKAFVNTAAERGGLDKMSIIYLVVMNQTDSRCLYFLALCMDNASVCDVLARSAGVLLLQKYGLQFHPQNARIRCMAHVVNLIVQAIIAEINKANDPEQDNYYIPNKHSHATTIPTTKRFSRWRIKRMRRTMEKTMMRSLMSCCI